LASLPFVLVHFVMPTPYEAVMMLLIGVFGSMGQVLVTYAYKLAPAAEVSIYDYTGILFSMVLASWILGEKLAWNSLVGAVLVIAAALLIYVAETRQHANP
ncbi:MAG: DMT family transporter, partial [Oscillospiraceae bacterium]